MTRMATVARPTEFQHRVLGRTRVTTLSTAREKRTRFMVRLKLSMMVVNEKQETQGVLASSCAWSAVRYFWSANPFYIESAGVELT